MYVDFKVTAWERIEIPDDLKKEFLEKLKQGLIKDANDVFAQLSDTSDIFCDYVDFSSDQFPKELNEGYPTIEVKEDKVMIYDDVNGFKQPDRPI